MNSLYASLSLILAEIVLFLLVLCGALIFLKLRQQRNDRKALAQLTKKLQDSKEEHLNRLSVKLKESHHLEGEALATAAKELQNREIEFYMTMMEIYASRDSAALVNLDHRITALIDAYSRAGATRVENTTVTNSNDSKELTELKDENNRLQNELSTSLQINAHLEKELAAAKKEMRETVAEFISAFSGGRDAAEEKIAQQQKLSAQKDEMPEPSPESPTGDTTDNGDAQPSSKEATAEQESTTDIASEPPVEEADKEATHTIEPEDEEEKNPFLSIDDIGEISDTNKTSDNPPDSNENETEFGIDLGLDSASAPQVTPPVTETTEKAATLADDDIDALLAASSADGEVTSARETGSSNIEEAFNPDEIDDLLAATAGDDIKPESTEEIDADDIDALLAATATDQTDESPLTPERETAKTDVDDIDALLAATIDSDTPRAVTATPADVNGSDIDAILEDVDMTTAGAVPNNKKAIDKAS